MCIRDRYKDKFYDSVWDTMVYKDDVYGLRITSNNLALFYNKELFEKAGLEEPKDWTWDDLREAAKKLTDPDNGIFGLDLPVYDKKGGYTWNWLPFLLSLIHIYKYHEEKRKSKNFSVVP